MSGRVHRTEFQESEELFWRVFEEGPLGMALVDPQLCTVTVNQSFCRMLGYDEPELVNRQFSEFTHPADIDANVALAEQLFRGEIPFFRMEKRYLKKNGDWLWANLTASIIRDADGNALYGLGMVADISDRKRHEEALRRSDAQLTQLLEELPDGVLVVSGERVVYANRALGLLTGCGLKDLIGKRPTDVLFPEDAPRALHRIQELLDGGSLPPLEYRMRRRDGAEVPVEVFSRRVSHGGQPSVLAVVRDLTQRNKAEEAQKRSEARYASILDTSPDAIVSVDEDQEIIVFNKGAERIFGYPADEIIRKPLQSLIAEAGRAPDRDGVDPWASLLTKSHATGRLEVHGRRKNGESFPAEITVSKQDIGEERLWTAILRDTTKRKALEEQYLHAQKMEAVGRLAAGVAHDLNNLLQGILGYAELTIMNLPGADPLRDNIGEILTCGKRAEALTRQLLIFSRKEAPQPRMLDINRTVKDMERMLRRLIGEGIELITALTSDSETVHMDPSQLEQIVMNLVINASDAMPSGGKIAIKVSREEVDDKRARGFPELEPGRYAKLVVADSGCGMDQETVSRIFEPFFTTKEIGKGTGLGLSTVFGIVQNAKGHIAVESAPDEGTVFTIFLPRCEAGVELARADSLREERSRGTEVVLLAEDDDVVRAFVAEVLEIYGYNVVAARSSGEALLIAERHGRSIDLLLTDLVMPYMSGAELAERVKKHHPAIRVLFMSGYAAASVPGDSSLDDRSYRLQKPFSPKEVSRRVREVLDASPQE